MGTMSRATNPEDNLQVAECLEKKLSSLKHFYFATAALKKSFDSGEVEQIDALLQEREKYKDMVDRIDDHIHKIRSDEPRHFSSLPDKTRTLIAALTDSIEKTLKEISALDKICNSAASSRHQLLKKALLEIMSARQVVQGYHGNKPHAPRFLDIRF